MTNHDSPRSSASPRALPPARWRAATWLTATLLLLSPAIVTVVGPAVGTLGGVTEAEAAKPIAMLPPPSPGPVRVGSADRLHRLFDRLGYELDAVAEQAMPVPPVELAALPPDLADLTPVDRRKALFIRAVLPIVIGANEAVLEERAVLGAMLAGLGSGRSLSREERRRFRRTAARYRLPDAPPDAEGIRRLLRRVDGVPVSLAIAQSISESGWGTSRFARTGNALFGQWTWDEAAGIVPAARASGESHRVRAFRSLADSARAYLFNLNTHPAYTEFRAARAASRRHGETLPAGEALARHLTRYSERGDAYVQDVLTLIRQNRLARLEGAALGETLRYADASPLRTTAGDG